MRQSKQKGAIAFWMLLLVAISATSVHAQLGLDPRIFDSTCYFPQVGKPGEIDTIYGSVPRQWLGNALTGIGPAPGQGYNRIAFQGFEPVPDSMQPQSTYIGFISPPLDVFQSGHDFNFHAIQSVAKNSIPLPYCQFAHLRTKQYLDAVYYTDGGYIEIYWSDESGNYDTSRVTTIFGGGGGRLVKLLNCRTARQSSAIFRTTAPTIF